MAQAICELIKAGVSFQTQQTSFERDTRPQSHGAGEFAATIEEHWCIDRGPNGGFLAALLLRALTDEVADATRAPRSFTVHYLRPPQPGTVSIQCAIEREGRALTTVSARMFQSQRCVAIALAAFSGSWSGVSFEHAPMPQVPPPQQTERAADHPIAFYSHFDFRWVLDGSPRVDGGPGVTGGWIQLDPPRPVDAPLAALFLDAWLPSPFPRSTRPGGAPTIDLTIHFRQALPARSDARHCLCCFRSRVAREGFFEEDGELFTGDGLLLAQSRQLAIAIEPQS